MFGKFLVLEIQAQKLSNNQILQHQISSESFDRFLYFFLWQYKTIINIVNGKESLVGTKFGQSGQKWMGQFRFLYIFEFFSNLAHYFYFLVSCMKLEDHFGSELTHSSFSGKFSLVPNWSFLVSFGAQIHIIGLLLKLDSNGLQSMIIQLSQSCIINELIFN